MRHWKLLNALGTAIAIALFAMVTFGIPGVAIARESGSEIKTAAIMGGMKFFPPVPQFIARVKSAEETFNSPRENSKPVEDLRDGNYRYCTSELPEAVVTDEELKEVGGYCFLFRKEGNKVLGNLFELESDNIICLDGRVNGNAVSGVAAQDMAGNPAKVVSDTEDFAPWDWEQNLKVRRGKVMGNKIKYYSALLDLNDFQRYNAGKELPPKTCP